MTDTTVRRTTAAAGLAAGLAGLAVVALYFLYSGPPPAWDVLTRDLLNIVLCVAFFVLVTGLRELVVRRDAGLRWVGDLSFGAGLLYVAVALVATSVEAGAVYAADGVPIDPTTDGPLAAANVLAHGTIGRILAAVFLFTAGVATRRAGVLPAWLARGAYLIAAINLLFVPSLYFGLDPAQFYSATGWGNTALTGSLIVYWAALAGVWVLCPRPATP